MRASRLYRLRSELPDICICICVHVERVAFNPDDFCCKFGAQSGQIEAPWFKKLEAKSWIWMTINRRNLLTSDVKLVRQQRQKIGYFGHKLGTHMRGTLGYLSRFHRAGILVLEQASPTLAIYRRTLNWNRQLKYSQTPHNAYPSVDSPGYALWGVMHLERYAKNRLEKSWSYW